MAHTPKALADGTVATSTGAIVTAGAGVVATYIKQILLGNTNAAEQTVNIYVNYSGTNRFFRRFVLAQYESANVLEGGESILLGPSDTIQADTTTSTAVAYTIYGVEET